MRLGMHARTELHRRNEAIADRAVDFLRRARIRGVERCQGTPVRRGKAHRQARLGVVERLHDVVRQALKAVDLTPRRLPSAKIALQSRSGGDQSRRCARFGSNGRPNSQRRARRRPAPRGPCARASPGPRRLPQRSVPSRRRAPVPTAQGLNGLLQSVAPRIIRRQCVIVLEAAAAAARRRRSDGCRSRQRSSHPRSRREYPPTLQRRGCRAGFPP